MKILFSFSPTKVLLRAIVLTVAGAKGGLAFFFSLSLSAQPTIQWQKCLGGNSIETAYASQQTTDGGYIIAGSAFSFNNGDVMNVHGGGDFWVVKLDSTGAIEWQKPLGGSSTEVPYSIKQTSDRGYIVAGQTHSSDGDVSGYHGGLDYWVVKLNSAGAIEWQRALGGTYDDTAQSVEQTYDGGYIVAGRAGSTDGDVQSQSHGLYEIWVVKLSATGDTQWEKLYGGSSAEIAYSIRQTSDGGYVFAGATKSNDGDVTGNNGNDDFWVVKIDSVGVIEWQKALGGIGADAARDVGHTSAGGYIVSGTAGSGNTGQVSGSHGDFDVWVVKLNNIGELQWQKALGGSKPDYGSSVAETSDEGYIISGISQSTNGDLLGNLDFGSSAWVVKLSGAGELQWQRALGGTLPDRLYAAQQTNDGGFFLAGETESNDGDVSGNHGSSDFWVVKLSPLSSPTTTPQTLPIEIFPNPATTSISLKTPTDVSTLNLSITDLLGRELSRQTITNGGNANISALPNGLYLITATTDSGKVYSGRFRKQE